MTKFTANALKGKLDIRNTFAAEVHQKATEHVIQLDSSHFNFKSEASTSLSVSEIKGILNSIGGFSLFRKDENGNIVIELSAHYVQIQKTRIELDKIIESEANKAIATGKNEFVVHLERNLTKELSHYLTEVLGFQIATNDNRNIICKF